MSRPRAFDLFCCAGGVSVGLARAGFDVVGVDNNPKVEKYWRRGMEPYGGHFVCADAMSYSLEGFDFIWASPPCQAHSSLRHLQPDKVYPDLIAATRKRLLEAGIPYAIENVPGAPLGGWLTLLCGTMFGLQTPDGRAEIRRHRLFETSFSIPLRPACQHGHSGLESLSVCGTGMGPGNRGKEAARRAISTRAILVTGNTAQTNTVRNTDRETFSADDARAAMGIDWMPMKYLSQAIPPVYAEWIGRQALAHIGERTNP